MIKRNKKAGFTLFEMLISVAIITIVAGIAFYNHNKFSTDIEITNVAYRMALAFRQAQVYSVSVRQFGQDFNVSYGLHFDNSKQTEFILFADADNDGLYTGDRNLNCSTTPGSECVEKVTIGRSNLIKGWCGFRYATDPVCEFTNNSEKKFLDVLFRRPDPDARFAYYEADYSQNAEQPFSACGAGINGQCSGWAVCLVSPQGREKRVVVYQSGQISVENVPEHSMCSDS